MDYLASVYLSIDYLPRRPNHDLADSSFPASLLEIVFEFVSNVRQSRNEIVANI